MSAWIVALLASLTTLASIGGLVSAWRRFVASREAYGREAERARQTEAAAQTRARLEAIDERARDRADSEHAEIDARPRAITTDERLADLVRRSRE